MLQLEVLRQLHDDRQRAAWVRPHAGVAPHTSINAALCTLLSRIGAIGLLFGGITKACSPRLK
jgi:hypothetical protein